LHDEVTVAQHYPQKLLVVDSTELTRDWFLRSHVHRLLRHLDWTIVVPASVRAEVVANHARAVASAEVELGRVTKDRRRLGLPDLRTDGTPLEYVTTLDETLELMEAEVTPWPNATHEEVVQRALERRPPFNQTGGGYRDTLVWLTLLERAHADDQVVLASSDTAFSDGVGNLAASLASEAADRGLNVTLARALDRWALDQVKWGAPTSVRDALDATRFDRFANECLAVWWFEDVWLDHADVGLPPNTGDVSLDAVVSSSDLEQVSFKSSPDGAALVQYRMEIRAELSAQMSESDAAERGLSGSDPDGAGRVLVTMEMDLQVEIDVLYDELQDLAGFDIVRLTFTPLERAASGLGPMAITDSRRRAALPCAGRPS
jgi:hypothetical protein